MLNNQAKMVNNSNGFLLGAADAASSVDSPKRVRRASSSTLDTGSEEDMGLDGADMMSREPGSKLCWSKFTKNLFGKYN